MFHDGFPVYPKRKCSRGSTICAWAASMRRGLGDRSVELTFAGLSACCLISPMRGVRRASCQRPTCSSLNTFWLPALMPRAGRTGRLFVHVGRFPHAQVRLYRHAVRLQAPSSTVAAALRARLPSCTDRICAIPYPLADGMLLESASELASARATRQKTIVFSGRVHPQKGLKLLIDA